MIVIGGGPLGLEFLQMLARFETKVILLHRSPTIAPREEPELSSLLEQYLQESDNIEIYTDMKILSAKKDKEEILIKTLINENEKLFKSEKVLIATDRRANIKDLHLEHVNVKLGFKVSCILGLSYLNHNVRPKSYFTLIIVFNLLYLSGLLWDTRRGD